MRITQRTARQITSQNCALNLPCPESLLKLRNAKAISILPVKNSRNTGPPDMPRILSLGSGASPSLGIAWQGRRAERWTGLSRVTCSSDAPHPQTRDGAPRGRSPRIRRVSCRRRGGMIDPLALRANMSETLLALTINPRAHWLNSLSGMPLFVCPTHYRCGLQLRHRNRLCLRHGLQ